MTAKQRIEEPTPQTVLVSFKKLSIAQQEELLKEFNKQVLLAKAKRLDATVKPNKITMQEIVEEVRIVRKKNHGNAQKKK